jgi:hypothetical protein
MNPSSGRVRGPYEPGAAGDEGFQLACRGCTIGDLVALANSRNVQPRHVLADVTRGTRRTRRVGKVASDRMGGRTWIWEISLNDGPPSTDVSLSIRQLLTKVKILSPRTV